MMDIRYLFEVSLKFEKKQIRYKSLNFDGLIVNLTNNTVPKGKLNNGTSLWFQWMLVYFYVCNKSR